MHDFETTLPSPEVDLKVSTGRQEVADLIQTALGMDQANNHEGAQQALDQALDMEPSNPSLYFLVARSQFAAGQIDQARQTIEHAISLNKKDANYFKLQGDVFHGFELYDQAVTSYTKALNRNGEMVSALNNSGCNYLLLGDSKNAKKNLSRAKHLNPGYCLARYNLARAMMALSENQEAEKELLYCTENAPNFAEAWFLLAKLREDLGDLEGTAETLLSALEPCGESVEIRLKLAQVLDRIGRAEEAQAQYSELDRIKPDLAEMFSEQSNIWMNRLEQPDAQATADISAKLNDKFVRHQLFMCAYLAVLDNEASFEVHRAWNENHCADARANAFSHGPGEPRDKLRIGYVSPDLYAHAVSFFIRSVFKHQDRERFEVIAYASVAKPDQTTDQLKELVDEWRDIYHLSDYEAARLINQDNIDILVDLSGHTKRSRVSLFAFRPAPIQVTYMGYPGSTGMTEMDYWLTDKVIHPSDTPEPSTEEKYRLDRCWMSYTPEDELPDLIERGSDEPITFGCINHIGKYSEAFIRTIAEILNRMPEAVFLLKSIEFVDSDLRIKVEERLASLGVDMKRLSLVGLSLTRLEHMGTYNKIDICLDPFPYTGGTSTADALVMGTPVISLAGGSLKERMSASMLTSIDRPDWISESQSGYVDAAVRLAEDPDLRKLKPNIRNSFLESDIVDGPGMATALDTAFKDMWDRYVARTS